MSVAATALPLPGGLARSVYRVAQPLRRCSVRDVVRCPGQARLWAACAISVRLHQVVGNTAAQAVAIGWLAADVVLLTQPGERALRRRSRLGSGVSEGHCRDRGAAGDRTREHAPTVDLRTTRSPCPVACHRMTSHERHGPRWPRRNPLASHASERWLDAAVGRGFASHDAAPDCVRPEADRRVQVDEQPDGDLRGASGWSAGRARCSSSAGAACRAIGSLQCRDGRRALR
jgi:hypothetical protein